MSPQQVGKFVPENLSTKLSRRVYSNTNINKFLSNGKLFFFVPMCLSQLESLDQNGYMLFVILGPAGPNA